MTLSLRHLARSRSLRALSVLAWLMLAVTALTALPASAQQALAQPSATPAATACSAAGHHALAHAHSQDRDHHAGSCCGAHDACRCIGTCAGMLPPTLGSVASTTPPAVQPARPRQVHAPAAATALPLRPPLA